MDQHLNIRAKIIQLLEGHTGENIHDIGSGGDFFGYDTKSTGNREKID